MIYLTSSVSKRLQVNCERPVQHCKTQDDALCDATATNSDNTLSRTMQQICIHLTITLQNPCTTWLKRNGHQCSHYMNENRALEMQQLNPSVIIDVKKSRQHENKRHQRNNDVRLRNNYSPDVRKDICHPRRLLYKSALAACQCPTWPEWTTTFATFEGQTLWGIGLRDVD